MIYPNHSAVHPEYLELWKTDVLLRKIEPLLATTRLLSLDIFDTLLFRACSLPTDVYILAAEEAVKTGVLRSSIRPREFRDIRIKAELQARDRFVGGEVTLEQIYAEIPASVCDGSRLLQIELETEQEVCYLNPNIASLLYGCKENQIQVALVSDMYLSSQQLSAILQGAGLDLARIDALLISNEQHYCKTSGEMFDRL